MKKYLLLIIFLLFMVGCSNNKISNVENINYIDEVENILPEEPIYVDENPVIVGLYQNGKLIHSVNTSINDGKDIAILDIYFTNEENVGSTNTKRNFNKFASNYEDVSKYKIGFIVSFSVGDELIMEMITGPKDMYALSPYIYNYLYDDVHQPDGSWYSHVTEDEVNDQTIYSSIKLYAASETSKITSPITLMVFTYDTEDDFDDMGMYRGNSKYTITIEK